MTKEQEVFERVNRIRIDFFDSKYKDVHTDDELEEKYEALCEVLSMLKEKDEIINEQLKENVRLQKELNEENKRCMILANNDKFKEQVIDLMAETFYKKFKPELLLVYGFESEEQLKQYFENKVNSSEQN